LPNLPIAEDCTPTFPAIAAINGKEKNFRVVACAFKQTEHFYRNKTA
jgi:hypothetical protein